MPTFDHSLPRIPGQGCFRVDLVALHEQPEAEKVLRGDVDRLVQDDPGDRLPAPGVGDRPLVGHEVKGVGHQLLEVDPVDGERLAPVFYLEWFTRRGLGIQIESSDEWNVIRSIAYQQIAAYA